MLNLNKFSIRHAISVSVTVMAAMVIDRYYSFSHEGWIVITALLVTQTTRGTPVKQSIYYSLLILAGMVIGATLAATIPSSILLQLVAVLVFISAGSLVYYYRPIQDVTFFTVMLLPIVLLVTLVFPHSAADSLPSRLIDVLLGAGIGIISGQMILPVRPYHDLVHGLTPILEALEDFSLGLSDLFLKNESNLTVRRSQVEFALLASGGMYPEWVYEAGFNPGLRSGFRFFLVNIERVSEIFFSLDYLVETGVQNHLTTEVQERMADVAKANGTLLHSLAKKLKGQLVDELKMDLMTDINALEAALAKELPGGLELLSFTHEYAQVAMFARDLKDTRMILMQLILSLPEVKK